MALTKERALRKDCTTGISEMQHRHFTTIVAIFRMIGAPREVVQAFADELWRTNDNFDVTRFMRAFDA